MGGRNEYCVGYCRKSLMHLWKKLFELDLSPNLLNSNLRILELRFLCRKTRAKAVFINFLCLGFYDTGKSKQEFHDSKRFEEH